MDTSIEFIDLSGVEEQERLWILNFLHTWDANVQVPWGKPNQCDQSRVAMENIVIGTPSKFYHPTNILSQGNIHDVNILNSPQQQHIYQPYTAISYHNQPLYSNIYRGPVDNQMNTMNNYQHLQQVASNVTATENAFSNNTVEYVNVRYDKQIVVDSNIQLNRNAANFVNSGENSHFCENGEQLLNDATLQQYNTKDTLQNCAIKPAPNLYNKDIYNDHNETVAESLGDGTRKSRADDGTELEHKKNVISDDANIAYGDNTNHQIENTQPGDLTNQQNIASSAANQAEEQKDEEKDKPVPVRKSWASLFSANTKQERPDNYSDYNRKSNGDFKNINLQSELKSNIKPPQIQNDAKSKYNDPTYYRLGEFLAAHNIDHRTISLQPRGLINRSNYCYINSILQALLACPPVYNLLSGLSEIIDKNAKRKLIPVICNMSKFVREFQHLPAAHRVSRRSLDKNQKDSNFLINCDTPFEPHYIFKMLNGIRNDTFVVEGRQEDAEEFLGCLLNGLNDEMLELMKLLRNEGPKQETEIDNDIDNDLDNKEWEEVTGKNKGCVTRRTELIHTPISDIFNGLLRSRVHRSGDKSTDNVQPFFTLQLNIEKASSVKEALEALVCKNQLEGITSSKTNEQVEAWQQVTIEELPYILILHLKCFDYKLDGCTKIIKALEFPIDLKIDGKLLSSSKKDDPKVKQYKLFAIVYHDGKEASKGHYLTDAYHVGYARWLRYDDASVKVVPEEQVLKPHGTRVPYLLFYRRSDSIRSK